MSSCNNCTNNDPCFCVSSPYVPPTPCPPTSQACCIKACNDIIYGADAVGPCGAVGTFDLSTLDHILTGCADSDSVVFILESWDENFFESVTLTQEGILTWITGDETTVDQYSYINFRIKCTSKEACGSIVLNAVGYLLVGVRNLCTELLIPCEEGEVCNLCTAECDPEIPDVEIT